MKIVTERVETQFPEQLPWKAVDADGWTGIGQVIGLGRTEQEAIDDLRSQCKVAELQHNQ